MYLNGIWGHWPILRAHHHFGLGLTLPHCWKSCVMAHFCHSQLTVAGSDESSVDAEVLRSDDNDVSPVRTAPSSVSSCNTDLQSSVI